MLLGYHVLCEGGPATAEEMQARAEQYMSTRFGVSIDFEVRCLCCTDQLGISSELPFHYPFGPRPFFIPLEFF